MAAHQTGQLTLGVGGEVGACTGDLAVGTLMPCTLDINASLWGITNSSP